jgi:hypothetical protein
VYHLAADDGWIVALGYHRPGTAQEKLTALSGAPGLLGWLADRVVAEIEPAGVISLKLEVPYGAATWRDAALAAGFTPLAPPLSAGPLPLDPGEVPAGFIRRIGGWRLPELAYYRQSTDFTCGPVAALTATHALARTPALSRAEELQFWREATSAPGCDGYGLAAALAARGVVPGVVVNTSSALQVEPEPAGWQRELREFTQQEFRRQAESAGVEFQLHDVHVDQVFAHVAAGRLVVLLIDEEVMHGEACPHWVVVHGFHDGVALVEDPWTDSDLGESWVDAHELAVTVSALEQMSGWGEPAYRSFLVIAPAHEGERLTTVS